MPEYYVAEQTFVDGINRPFSQKWHVTQANAEAWITAADHTARDATNIGLLFAAERGMTDGALTGQRVFLQYEPSTVGAIADTILRGNKLSVAVNSNTHTYVSTIGARKQSSYVQGVDSLVVSLTTPAAMTAYVSAIESFALGPYDLPQLVTQIKVVD